MKVRRVENLMAVAVNKLMPTKNNPRIFVKDAAFAELVTSVQANGVMNRVLVRPVKGGKLELIAGERRYRAAKEAKLKTIPAIVHTGLTEAEAFELTFLENFARQDLTALEEGRAVELLMEKLGDIKEVAEKLGWSERAVRMRAKLKDLAPEWKKAVLKPESKASKLTPVHLELIARLPIKTQKDFYKGALDSSWNTRLTDYKGMVISLRALEQMLGSYVHLLAGALWDVKDCAKCRNRSDAKDLEALWSKGKNPLPRCLDSACWDKRTETAIEAQKTKLEADHPGLRFIEVRDGGRTYGNFHGALSPWNYTRVAKGQQEAVAAMQVNGTSPGRLCWIRPNVSSSGSTSTGSTGPKSMKAKRAELNSKRWYSAITELQKQIDKLPITAVQDGKMAVIALAACFGTRDPGYQYNNWAEWKKVDKKAGALKVLWERVRPVLYTRVGVSCYGVTQVPDRAIKEAEKISKLLGINLKAIFKEQVKAIPEPKSWKK